MLENKEYKTLVRFLMETHYDKKYKVSKRPLYTLDGDDIHKCGEELIKIFNTYVKICPSSSPV